jgi:hypothetical protein
MPLTASARLAGAFASLPFRTKACHWVFANSLSEKSLRALRHAQNTAGQDDARPRRGPPIGLAESVEAVISSPATRPSVIGVFRDAAAVSAPVSRSGGRSRAGG